MLAAMPQHSFLMLAAIFMACQVQCLPEGSCLAYQPPARTVTYTDYTSSISSTNFGAQSQWSTSSSTTSSVIVPSLHASPVFIPSTVTSSSFTTSVSTISNSTTSSSADVTSTTLTTSSYSLTISAPPTASSDSPIKQITTTKYWNGWNSVRFLFTL